MILTEPEDDLAGQAIALTTEWGPVYSGSPAGDFSTVNHDNDTGWVVTSHRKGILTYVDPCEVSDDTSDLVVGLFAHSNRDQDYDSLIPFHEEFAVPTACEVEDERLAASQSTRNALQQRCTTVLKLLVTCRSLMMAAASTCSDWRNCYGVHFSKHETRMKGNWRATADLNK